LRNRLNFAATSIGAAGGFGMPIKSAKRTTTALRLEIGRMEALRRCLKAASLEPIVALTVFFLLASPFSINSGLQALSRRLQRFFESWVAAPVNCPAA
jgi:hypothetical protein